MSLGWPGNASGSPLKSWRKCLGFKPLECVSTVGSSEEVVVFYTASLSALYLLNRAGAGPEGGVSGIGHTFTVQDRSLLERLPHSVENRRFSYTSKCPTRLASADVAVWLSWKPGHQGTVCLPPPPRSLTVILCAMCLRRPGAGGDAVIGCGVNEKQRRRGGGGGGGEHEVTALTVRSQFSGPGLTPVGAGGQRLSGSAADDPTVTVMFHMWRHTSGPLSRRRHHIRSQRVLFLLSWQRQRHGRGLLARCLTSISADPAIQALDENQQLPHFTSCPFIKQKALASLPPPSCETGLSPSTDRIVFGPSSLPLLSFVSWHTGRCMRSWPGRPQGCRSRLPATVTAAYSFLAERSDEQLRAGTSRREQRDELRPVGQEVKPAEGRVAGYETVNEGRTLAITQILTNSSVAPATRRRPFSLNHAAAANGAGDERGLRFELYAKRREFKQAADMNKHSVIYFCHYKPSPIVFPPPRLRKMRLNPPDILETASFGMEKSSMISSFELGGGVASAPIWSVVTAMGRQEGRGMWEPERDVINRTASFPLKFLPPVVTRGVKVSLGSATFANARAVAANRSSHPDFSLQHHTQLPSIRLTLSPSSYLTPS
ncbi:hypothetical protein L3Q82_000961 [Scortum barcoo]|uniref:Uncharacterized protein n=1 Tax=Scortum barcoo TaxID=214431 RepID=A0ACB8WA27_9TELE|nr:hypothetical protein L3Q82_000961 [Scortum barcoo]